MTIKHQSECYRTFNGVRWPNLCDTNLRRLIEAPEPPPDIDDWLAGLSEKEYADLVKTVLESKSRPTLPGKGVRTAEPAVKAEERIVVAGQRCYFKPWCYSQTYICNGRDYPGDQYLFADGSWRDHPGGCELFPTEAAAREFARRLAE